jgi:drug/metabolite transporter (DMT)-like permease
MFLISFAPGIIYGIAASAMLPLHFSRDTLVSLVIKNVLYCLSFHYRYESLRKFGPFIGSLMLGTQPILIFLLGWLVLGETISPYQIVSVVLVALALLALANQKQKTSDGSVTLTLFGKYYLMPTLASTLAIIWDRFFLKGKISPKEFFILDRLMLVPALLIVMLLLSRRDPEGKTRHAESWEAFKRNWKSAFAIALLFTLSVYAYNSALEVGTAAVVGLFRNSAYPLAAFLGTFIFQRKTSNGEWTSLALVLAAVLVGVC